VRSDEHPSSRLTPDPSCAEKPNPSGELLCIDSFAYTMTSPSRPLRPNAIAGNATIAIATEMSG